MRKKIIVSPIIFLSFILSGCSFAGATGKTYSVMWMNRYTSDGGTEVLELLKKDEGLKKGDIPSYVGDTPTRPSDSKYTYTFSSWTPEIVPITEDTMYYTVYTSKEITYKVDWYNENGQLIKTTEVASGQKPKFSDDNEVPSKEGDEQYSYTFVGWAYNPEYVPFMEEELLPVYSDTSLYAKFSSSVNQYTVTWVNYDNSVLDEEDYDYGSTPSFKGVIPVRQGNENISEFPFIGWDKEIVAVTGPATYKAIYDTFSDPDVSFNFTKNDDGYTITGFKLTKTKDSVINLSIPSTHLDEPVTEIAYDAFSSMKSLRSLIIPDSVTKIADGAFRNNELLDSLTLGSGLLSIGNSAFAYCDKLKTVVVPDSVTHMGEHVFHCCPIVTITLPFIGTDINTPQSFAYVSFNSPTKIKNIVITKAKELANSFLSSKLLSLTLPNSITKMGGLNAENVYYDGELSDWLKIENGSNTITNLFLENELVEHVSITNIKKIPDYSLNGIQSLKTASIDGQVEEIGKSAFAYSYLERVDIGSSVTAIDDNAFYYTHLTKVILGKNIKNIGKTAFYTGILADYYYQDSLAKYCEIDFVGGLITRDNTSKLYFLDEDGEATFENKKYSLHSELVIPDGVTEVKQYQFIGLKQFTSIDLNNVTSVGEQAFAGCDNVTSITIPNTCTTLGRYAFYDSKVKNITANGVTALNNAFFGGRVETLTVNSLEATDYQELKNMEYLKSIIINDSDTLSTQSDIVFNKDKTEVIACPQMNSGTIYLPYTVKTIKAHAFDGCSAITNIVLPNGLETIEEYAFANMSLKNSFAIPDSVTSIGENIFTNTTITNLSIPFLGSDIDTPEPFSYLFGKTGTGKAYNITVLDGCESIHTDAFKNDQIESVTLPSSITSIPKGVFVNTKGIKTLTLPFVGGSLTSNQFFSYLFNNDSANSYKNIPVSLKDVTILGGTTLIDRAFFHMGSLERIIIPDSITSIGSEVFFGCSSLVTLRAPFFGETVNDTSNNGTFTHLFGVGKTITGGDAVIPETLTTFILGNGMTTLAQDSFYYVKYLQYIEIEGTTLTSIATEAIHNLNNLKTFAVPDTVTSLGTRFLSNCSNLEEVNLGNGVTTLNLSILYGCTKVKTLTIGENVTDFSQQIVNGANNIETLYFNAINCVTGPNYNSNSTFYNSTKLTKVVFGDKVTKIPGIIFRSCSNLKTVTFGKNLSIIGDYAFAGCTSLTTITYNNTKANWDYVNQSTHWRDNSGITTIKCLNNQLVVLE